MKVGYKKTNKDYTTQCKHCGSTAEFLEQIGETLYFVCTECRGFTPVKDYKRSVGCFVMEVI